MKTLISIVFWTITVTLLGQKQDYIWPMGYDGSPMPGKQNFLIDFTQNSASIQLVDLGMSIGESNAFICTENGQLELYTNGCDVNNNSFIGIENGDSLVLPGFKEFCVNIGYYRSRNGTLILPWPQSDSLFAIIQVAVQYQYQPILSGWTAQLSYSKVDNKYDNENGIVLEKNVQILWDSLGGGQLEAVRHANGRDWWLIQSRLKTNKYFVFLFDPTGIHLDHEQFIGSTCEKNSSWMQAAFSPDGKLFAKAYDEDEAWLFDFDRCSGMLSNYRNIKVPEYNPNWTLPFNGLAFSPNCKLMYLSLGDYLYQFDITSSDINGSALLIEKYTPLPNPEYFGHMSMGPDGKIYMDGINGIDKIHVIQSPDVVGIGCVFEKAGIVLTNQRFYHGLPNFPNWRLGPLDGSPCDTLGIDNLPWAHWRWAADTASPLEVRFRDLSGFAPTGWYWDFGDGNTSTETNPIHDYAAAGIYQVCEIVSNDFGADTLCREVTVQTVSIPTIFDDDELKTAPNPVSDEWNLYFAHPLERDSELRFFDVGGRLVFSEKIRAGTAVGQVSLGGLPGGLFVWQLSQKGVLLKVGRVVKVE